MREGPVVELGAEQEFGSVWWRGRRVRGKGRTAIQLKQQISTKAQSQCQGAEWAARGAPNTRLTRDLKAKIVTLTNTVLTPLPIKLTCKHTHRYTLSKACNISALKCPLNLFPQEETPVASLFSTCIVHDLLSVKAHWQDKTQRSERAAIVL